MYVDLLPAPDQHQVRGTGAGERVVDAPAFRARAGEPEPGICLQAVLVGPLPPSCLLIVGTRSVLWATPRRFLRIL